MRQRQTGRTHAQHVTELVHCLRNGTAHTSEGAAEQLGDASAECALAMAKLDAATRLQGDADITAHEATHTARRDMRSRFVTRGIVQAYESPSCLRELLHEVIRLLDSHYCDPQSGLLDVQRAECAAAIVALRGAAQVVESCDDGNDWAASF